MTEEKVQSHNVFVLLLTSAIKYFNTHLPVLHYSVSQDFNALESVHHENFVKM